MQSKYKLDFLIKLLIVYSIITFHAQHLKAQTEKRQQDTMSRAHTDTVNQKVQIGKKLLDTTGTAILGTKAHKKSTMLDTASAGHKLSSALPLSARDIIKHVHYGFKLNPTFGYLRLKRQKNIEGNGLKLGFSMGVTADYSISKFLSLSAEFAFTSINGGIIANMARNEPLELPPAGMPSAPIISKLSSGSIGGTGPTVQSGEIQDPVQLTDSIRLSFQIQYIELPLALKFKTRTIGEASTFYAKLGIDPALKIGARRSQTVISDNSIRISPTTEIGSQIRTLRLGYIVGVGYDYKFTPSLSFTSGLTLNNSFTSISTDRSSQNFKNAFFAIEFGLYF